MATPHHQSAAPPILYEDGEALVIDKPAGLPVDQPKRGGASLEDYLPALRLGFKRLPRAVHRLDQDTSGCLLLARNPKALKRFGALFAERAVSKIYLGIVAGEVCGEAGTIDLPLGKTSTRELGWRMVVDPEGKAAKTHWKLLARHGGQSLIGFRPVTGRTHQIRIHAAAGLGVPLLGDPIYGEGGADKRGQADQDSEDEAPRTMLHASDIELLRPGKTPITAHAPLPEDFKAQGFTEPDEAQLQGWDAA